MYAKVVVILTIAQKLVKAKISATMFIQENVDYSKKEGYHPMTMSDFY